MTNTAIEDNKLIMATKNIIVWIREDIYGGYYVYGTYFYDKVKGDRSNTKYTIREKQMKKIEDLPKMSFTKLKKTIIKKAKTYDFKPIIEKIN